MHYSAALNPLPRRARERQRPDRETDRYELSPPVPNPTTDRPQESSPAHDRRRRAIHHAIGSFRLRGRFPEPLLPLKRGSPLAHPHPLFGTPMQDTIDAIRATIEIAARQGYAPARIELQPEELGHISIRLLQTSEGLRARVSADTPAGAQALTQGRSELRQTLTSLGVSVLHLDIGSSGHSSCGPPGRDFGAQLRWKHHLPLTQALGGPCTRGRSSTDSIAPQPSGPALGEIVDILA